MQKIVFFDGVCTLCNRSVNFLMKQDKTGVLKFVSLQSDFANTKLPKKLLTLEGLDTLVYFDGNRFYTKSTAVLQLCKLLGGVFYIFLIGYLLPRFIRDGLYGFVANSRYRWFGKKDQCMVPTKAQKERFLD